MIKYIGAILITAGAALWGLTGAKSLRDRGTALRAIVTALDMMECEICERLTPVPELFHTLAETAPIPADRLFRNGEKRLDTIGAVPFSKIWRQAVEETEELMLTGQEKLTLCEIGLTLGKYDIGGQRRAIETAKARFEDWAKKAEEERDKSWKSQAALGAAAGLFAVIILL